MRYCISTLFVLAMVPLGGLAKPLSPRWNNMHTKHSWNTVPKNWESLGSPPSGTTIDLYIALKPHRESALIDELYEVSEPEHPRYGEHLSQDQVAELVAPHPITLDIVSSWLNHHGMPTSSMTHGGNTLVLEGVSITEANTLLGASYQLYRHIQTNETIVRTVGYALPAVLHTHVLTVVPTTSFVSPPSKWQTPRNHPGGEASVAPTKMLSSRFETGTYYVTPPFLRLLYNMAAYEPAVSGQNGLGVTGFLGDYPNPDDLTAFMKRYRSEGVDKTYSVVEVNNGGYDPNIPHLEPNLDTQYTQALVYPTPVTFYSTGQGKSGTNDWYISWLRYVIFQPIIPQTITSSYSMDESSCSKEYVMYVCLLFAQLGARGVSVLFSTEDHGVGEGHCIAADGFVKFNPAFPATCPYVTAVGAAVGFVPEVGATFSGGGFSNYFKRPKFQKEVVSNFLDHLGSTYQGLYNNTGRGIPDISAQADDFRIYFKGELELVAGTSGSTPVVASIISLLNDYRISQGIRPFGFLNPWLYSKGCKGLTDITRGSNPGCDTDGFSATVGWDPVTGLGTPDFVAMQKFALQDTQTTTKG